MSAICPFCGRSLFLCQFCNSELITVGCSLVDDTECIAHFCSNDCIDLAVTRQGFGINFSPGFENRSQDLRAEIKIFSKEA